MYIEGNNFTNNTATSTNVIGVVPGEEEFILGNNIFYTSKLPRNKEGDQADCSLLSIRWKDEECNNLRSYPDTVKVEILTSSGELIEDPIYHNLAGRKPWTEEQKKTRAARIHGAVHINSGETINVRVTMYAQGRQFKIPSTLIGELSFLKHKKPNYYQIED